MKKVLLFIFCVMLFEMGFAQNRNSIWCFGDSAGINFNSAAVPIFSSMDGRGSCVSYSDSTGNIQLYAATLGYLNSFWNTRCFNNQNLILSGCDSVTGEAWYNELALVPKPNSDSLFYLFSVGVESGIDDGLYLTKIDMSLNGGLGAVTQENIQLDNNLFADCLTAVKHGNGRDWWVIGKTYTIPLTSRNRYQVYLVTQDSIYVPSITDFNDAIDVTFQKIVWHPSFQKFMLINARGYMSEFNFDRCTGGITFIRNIFPEQTGNYTRSFWEGAYSPNGDIFYTSRTSYGGNIGDYNYLLQYDLLAADIPASCDTLDSTMYPPVDCGALRLAPDGKIYYSQAYISATALSYPYADTMRNNINEYLGVINNPDALGSGCNFAPFSFYLGGKRTYYGLPNNPDYSLGPLAGSACDTVTSNGNPQLAINKKELHISYHPQWQIAFINTEGLQGKKIVLSIYDLTGREVYGSTSLTTTGDYFAKDLDCKSFSNGMYIVTLQTAKEKLVGRFVKE